MYQISRYHASMAQIRILNQLDKFIRNCPNIPHLMLEKKDYDALFLLLPNEKRRQTNIKFGYQNKEIVCR